MRKIAVFMVMAVAVFSGLGVCIADDYTLVVKTYKELCEENKNLNEKLKTDIEDLVALVGKNASYDLVIQFKKNWVAVVEEVDVLISDTEQLLENFPVNDEEALKVLNKIKENSMKILLAHRALIGIKSGISTLATEELKGVLEELKKMFENKMI